MIACHFLRHAPILRGESNGPEPRTSPVKLKSNCERCVRWPFNSHYPTTYFLSSLWVEKSDLLIDGHSKGYFQQATVSIHDQGECLYLQTLASGHLRPNKDSDLEQNPLASPSILETSFAHEPKL